MFKDDDLNRLKEEFEPYVAGDPRILTGSDWLGLVARLEAAEKYIEAIQTLFAKANAAYEKPADKALDAWLASCGKSGGVE